MNERLTATLQAAERETVSAIRREQPERLERPAAPDPDLVLGRIGVTFLPPGRPDGYIRLFPHDFVVEEILTDGSVVSVVERAPFSDAEDRRTLWADCVKVAIPWPHALADLEETFGPPTGRIGHAGIKDAFALTAQRLSLRGLTKERAEAVTHECLLLHPVRYGSGALQPGDLKGNRFTIFVRGDSRRDIAPFMDRIRAAGCVNFFGAQRFGTRLIAHRLGQSVLQNDVEGALRAYFGEPGLFDVPLYRDLRLSLAESFGDWDTMLALAGHFPYTLRDEIQVLTALRAQPAKTRAALALIKDQVKMWVYAYASWLMNRRFSQIIEAGGEVAGPAPLPLSPRGPLPEYREAMAYDRTDGYRNALVNFPYIQAADRTIPSRIVPEALSWNTVPHGWVVRFELPKGAYATSCLSHAFRIYEGLPVPSWVGLEEMDSFAALGEGSLEPIRERFASVLKRRDLRGEDTEEKE